MWMRSVLVLVLVGAVVSDRVPNEYIINLDATPAERWVPMLNGETNLVSAMTSFFGSFVPPEALPLIEKLAGSLEKYMPQPYADEIMGMAKHMNTSVGLFLLPNLIYDFTAFCTSIIGQDKRGGIWHGRNLDYGLNTGEADVLRNMTVVIHFQRGGKTVYSAVTYAGYIGILTGQKPHAFTFSLDQRGHNKPVDFLLNLLVGLLDKKVTLTGFLVRDTFEQASDFEVAVSTLSQADTMAPSYMIVGGTAPGEGAVITKKRLGSADVWRLDVAAGRWFEVETNYDHWLPPRAGDDRRTPAQKSMNATGPGGLSKASLYTVLSTPPVLSRMTTFTTVMSAAQPDVFQTWVRYVKVSNQLPAIPAY